MLFKHGCLSFAIALTQIAHPFSYASEEEGKLSQEVDKQTTPKAEVVTFTPPSGWVFADSNELPTNVKVMVVGKGEREYPPSMNLTTKPYDGTLKEYLKLVKKINDSQGDEWKDLGTIQTQTGAASLSQLNAKTEWGDVRMMHVIFIKDGTAYILTAACLKDEFPKYYKDFFTSMRSIKVCLEDTLASARPSTK